MNKNILIIIGLCVVVFGSVALNQIASTQSSYEGLPTVPCIDPTKPILENFSLTVRITIDNKLYPLNGAIGHDNGNCLHTIYTNDTSGRVFVNANDKEDFTLGQFFDVWHKTFSEDQLLNYQKSDGHQISVLVNNQRVDTYRATLLHPNETIDIICK